MFEFIANHKYKFMVIIFLGIVITWGVFKGVKSEKEACEAMGGQLVYDESLTKFYCKLPPKNKPRPWYEDFFGI